MDALTIHEAAQTTGWSARMLRYIERAGLVDTPRSDAGYRLYGPPELQRLRTLRELLDGFDVSLTDIGFARRLQSDTALRTAVDGWLSDQARRPDHVAPDDWMSFEQQKHERLLRAATLPTTQRSTPLAEAR